MRGRKLGWSVTSDKMNSEFFDRLGLLLLLFLSFVDIQVLSFCFCFFFDTFRLNEFPSMRGPG